MNVTFLGLGIMGSRMAANLLKNGVSLTIYNRSIDKTKELEANGAAVAASPAEAVKEADVVFSMLSKPEVVAEVAGGEAGFLTTMKPNALWVDCTTVNPSFSLEARQMAQDHQVRFLEAPIAGTKPHAANAELVFFVEEKQRI